MEQIIQEYANGSVVLQKSLENLTVEQLNWREHALGWSIKEIAIHVCDTEIVITHRLKQVISDDNPLLISFDQNAWVTRQNSGQLDLQLNLEIYRLLRESMVPIFNSLQTDDWARTGVHNEAGLLTLNDLIHKSIQHTQTHIKQIQRVKDANGLII